MRTNSLLDILTGLVHPGLRRLHGSSLPDRIVTLLTNPRSGSTWLLDSLRCHPDIYIHPSAVIYRFLGLRGRRYPRDLSNGPEATLEVEVHPGQWERIPEFVFEARSQALPAEVLRRPFAIEKYHPHFFHYDVDAYLSRVDKLEEKACLRPIYQVRDPKASFVSFLAYQRRSPSWNAQRSPDEVAQHMRKIYDSILEVAVKRPGLIVDYAELVDDFEWTIAEVFGYLWAGELDDTSRHARKLIHAIARLTSRDRRVIADTPFLGDAAGSTSGSEGFDDFFSTHKREINHCYRAYDRLREMKCQQLNREFAS